MHPISEETGVGAGQGVEPSPGPGNCRPPGYLPHTQNSSEILASWADTQELSRCMNYLEITPMHNEFRNTSKFCLFRLCCMSLKSGSSEFTK